LASQTSRGFSSPGKREAIGNPAEEREFAPSGPDPRPLDPGAPRRPGPGQSVDAAWQPIFLKLFSWNAIQGPQDGRRVGPFVMAGPRSWGLSERPEETLHGFSQPRPMSHQVPSILQSLGDFPNMGKEASSCTIYYWRPLSP
jgi:hypothetical protein